MALNRATKDLRLIQSNPNSDFTATPINDDLFHWKGTVHGPAGTPYEGGIFYLNIVIPFDYPLKPPQVNFITKIYHPNVGSKGEICLDILKKKWNPIENISNVLQSIFFLLSTPDPDDALIADIGSQYKNERAAFNQTAMEWTQQYAHE